MAAALLEEDEAQRARAGSRTGPTHGRGGAAGPTRRGGKQPSGRSASQRLPVPRWRLPALTFPQPLTPPCPSASPRTSLAPHDTSLPLTLAPPCPSLSPRSSLPPFPPSPLPPFSPSSFSPSSLPPFPPSTRLPAPALVIPCYLFATRSLPPNPCGLYGAFGWLCCLYAFAARILVRPSCLHDLYWCEAQAAHRGSDRLHTIVRR